MAKDAGGHGSDARGAPPLPAGAHTVGIHAIAKTLAQVSAMGATTAKIANDPMLTKLGNRTLQNPRNNIQKGSMSGGDYLK